MRDEKFTTTKTHNQYCVNESALREVVTPCTMEGTSELFLSERYLWIYFSILKYTRYTCFSFLLVCYVDIYIYILLMWKHSTMPINPLPYITNCVYHNEITYFC